MPFRQGRVPGSRGGNGGREVAEEALRYKDLEGDKGKTEEFRRTSTDESAPTLRGAAELVMKRGFVRSSVDYHMLYRVFHDEQFHESAEGVSCELGRFAAINRDRQKRMASITNGAVDSSPLFVVPESFGKGGHNGDSDITGVGRTIASKDKAMDRGEI